MSKYQLAQVNIGVPKGPVDSAVMAEFFARLDAVNALAEASPGFVWRLKDEGGNATAFRPYADETLINLSVWADPVALRNFVYRSAHGAVMRRRREWFEPMAESYLAMWWVPNGHRPTLIEAVARLERLRAAGPSAEAFTFSKLYPAPDAAGGAFVGDISEPCPAL